MPRRSYAAHRAARQQQGHGYGHGSGSVGGGYAESETDAESLASYSTFLSGTSYGTYDSGYSALQNRTTIGVSGGGGSHGNGGIGYSYGYGYGPAQGQGAGSHVQGYDQGYGRPQIRSRTFSASSSGSTSPSRHMGGTPRLDRALDGTGISKPKVPHEPQQLPALAHPRLRYLHPNDGRGARTPGSKMTARSASFSPSDSIPEVTTDQHECDLDNRSYRADALAQPHTEYRDHLDSSLTSSHIPSDTSTYPRIHIQPTSSGTNTLRPNLSSPSQPPDTTAIDSANIDRRADRAKRRELRHARRTARRHAREAKSTLTGERYGTVLRGLMRLAAQRGWGGAGMVGMGSGVVGAQRGLGVVLAHHYRASSSPSRITPIARLALEIALVWPVVSWLLMKQGASTGRTMRSQATAITTFLLSPAIAMLLSGPTRLASLDLAMTLVELALMQYGRLLEALCLAGVGLVIMGEGGMWVAVVVLLVWNAHGGGGTKWGSSGNVAFSRFVAFILGSVIMSIAYMGSKSIYTVLAGQGFEEIISIVDHRHVLGRANAGLSGWTVTEIARAVCAVFVAIAGCAIPFALLSSAASSLAKETARSATRKGRYEAAGRPSIAVVPEIEVASPVQDEVKEPAHLGGMGTTSQASHSPADPASADPHANLGAKAILSNLKDDTSAPESALTPLYPLFTLAIYIPLSIAMHVFPSAHHPKAFVDYSLLAPAISLALVGSYRGRSSRSRTESGQSGRINSSTDGHKLEGLSEEDEGWEMHSLVQLLLLCAAYPIVSREQMWGGVTAAVWCVVILGWRPWCVSRGEGLGRNISGAVQSSFAYAAPCAVLLYCIDTSPILSTLSVPRWLIPTGVMTQLTSTFSPPGQHTPRLLSNSTDWISLQLIADAVDFTAKLRAALHTAGILAWALVWVWTVNRLVKQTWAIGGLV